MDTAITVDVVINAPVTKVWSAFTTPGDIRQWSAVADGAHTTECTVDLREGGKFNLRMGTQGGRPGSSIEGTITKLIPYNLLALSFGDRTASVQFNAWGENNVDVSVVFNAESESSMAQEQEKALTILQNFARYVQPDY